MCVLGVWSVYDGLFHLFHLSISFHFSSFWFILISLCHFFNIFCKYYDCGGRRAVLFSVIRFHGLSLPTHFLFGQGRVRQGLSILFLRLISNFFFSALSPFQLPSCSIHFLLSLASSFYFFTLFKAQDNTLRLFVMLDLFLFTLDFCT